MTTTTQKAKAEDVDYVENNIDRAIRYLRDEGSRVEADAVETLLASHSALEEEVARLKMKADLFDAIMADVPDAYEKDGNRIFTGPTDKRRPVSHFEAFDAVHVITVARDKYRELLSGKAQQC